MRKSLQKSIDDSIVKNFDRYPKGSIVLCNACALPIFKLDFGIALDDKAGKSVGAFKPVAMADLETLATRQQQHAIDQAGEASAAAHAARAAAEA